MKNRIRKVLGFFPEVKKEISKVIWPSRRETVLTTVFVFIFALVAAIYFLIVDNVVFAVIKNLLIDDVIGKGIAKLMK